MAAVEYYNGGSFLNRLDPRVKILLALLFTLVIFAVSHPLAAAAFSLGVMSLWFAAKMPFGKIKKYIKLLSVLILLITVMQMLFGPGNHFILKPLIPGGVPLIGGRGSLKWEGLALGFVGGCRLLSLVLLLPLLTGTTPPQSLARGFCGLGINYKGAFIITTAINLVPALEDEARCIMDAQKLRGLCAFEKGNIRDKLKAYPSLAVPLIIAAMRRAQSMAFAMDSRAFGAYPRRTWRETLRIKPADCLAAAVSVVCCALVLSANFFLNRNLR